MASADTGTGLVGYNLQAAIDTQSHIVVAREVLNLGHDRTSLAAMGRQAAAAIGTPALTVLADRGYFSESEVLACDAAGITAICPEPLTSGSKAGGCFGKEDFVYHTQRHLAVPGRQNTDPPLFQPRTWVDAARLCDARVSLPLPDQVVLHRRHRERRQDVLVARGQAGRRQPLVDAPAPQC